MSDVKSKVIAASGSIGIAAYAVLVLLDSFHTGLNTLTQGLIAGAAVGLIGLGAGWLKREHVIDDKTYEAVVGPDGPVRSAVNAAESVFSKHEQDDADAVEDDDPNPGD